MIFNYGTMDHEHHSGQDLEDREDREEPPDLCSRFTDGKHQ